MSEFMSEWEWRYYLSREFLLLSREFLLAYEGYLRVTFHAIIEKKEDACRIK